MQPQMTEVLIKNWMNRDMSTILILINSQCKFVWNFNAQLPQATSAFQLRSMNDLTRVSCFDYSGQLRPNDQYYDEIDLYEMPDVNTQFSKVQFVRLSRLTRINLEGCYKGPRVQVPDDNRKMTGRYKWCKCASWLDEQANDHEGWPWACRINIQATSTHYVRHPH